MKINQHIKSRKLWIIFTFLTFAIMSVTLTIMIVAFALAYQRGYINPHYGMSGFIPFSVTSVLVATVLSMVVSRTLLTPIRKVSEATKKIAKGDFSTRISENSFIEEIANVGKNFNLMMTELEKVEGFRRDFGASVSHEFKTPLGKIKGYAELLSDGGLSPAERDECISNIIMGVDRLNALSEKMLALTQFENQYMVLNKTEFILSEQIRQAFLTFETRWVNKEIEPIFDLEELKFNGDMSLIFQIWTNLIDNAIKFTPVGGKIKITLKKQDNNVVVKIFNSGEGISPEHLPRIFDKFYRVDKARNDSGSGLGLPLVKRITELCGGKITVKSEKGEGTEFKVTLPVE